MILKPPLNLNSGVDHSTPSLSIALLNISLQTPKILKYLLIFWPNIFKANRLMTKLMILLTLTAWVMQYGISFHLFTRPNGMCYLLIKNQILSGLKLLQSLPCALFLPMAIQRRTFLS